MSAAKGPKRYSIQLSPFLNKVRKTMQLLHSSRKTEASYLHYIADYIRFHGKRHPVAFSALLFLYARVLKAEMGEIEGVERARRSRYQPTVFTKDEVRAILAQNEGVNGLILELTYGTGMRLSEALRLRVKDIDFGKTRPPFTTPREGKVAIRLCL